MIYIYKCMAIVNFQSFKHIGLIPSSEISWKTACHALKLDTGGYLHIHGNVDVNKSEKTAHKHKPEWVEWAEDTRLQIKALLDARCPNSTLDWSVSTTHIEYVKSYGPRVDHLVLDLLCRNKISS